MIDEKAFADFTITRVLIFSFCGGGGGSYKMCMIRKLQLHKKNQIPRLTSGFHCLGKRMGAHMLCFRKKYAPDICHFLIVLHDQCNLDFEYSKTYKTL